VQELNLLTLVISYFQYYTQTHKLCNCLEKLLLVTSSAEAFGGSTGGNTTQSRTEERELAALADFQGRQEMMMRQKRLRRKTSSPTDDLFTHEKARAVAESGDNTAMAMDSGTGASRSPCKTSPERGTSPSHKCGNDSHSDEVSLEQLEAARASLRTKFDHVGIDPHHLSPERDVRAIVEDRRMTNSPPPPSLSMSPGASNIGLPGHSGVTGFHRGTSPVLFSSGSDPSHLTAASNMHMLQLHHAASMAGSSMNRGNLDLSTIYTGPISPTKVQELSAMNASYNADLDGDQGRSSTSNSDVDSESDDISFDDSASDRSDGSDSGAHSEPFTAARAMALNRMQQQQRLQSRNLASLSSLHQAEGFRSPADSEYQSGDSIDSTRAEDSGGSDSSSSDLAD
jgi:hypothetical protein